MNETLHVRILKEDAVSVINELQATGAVELLTDEEFIDIPQWQIDLVRKSRKDYEDHPEEFISLEELFKDLKCK